MAENRRKRILISPLDWGLGHTTRCLPIIKHIQYTDHQPVVACNAWQRAFIEKAYSGIEYTHIEGYGITYSKNRNPGKTSNLKLVPQVCHAVKKEQAWLQHNFEALKIDGIISDNRYGLYSNKVPSVIMTHQLLVQSGMGDATDRLVQRIHYRFLEKFSAVWVPDAAGDTNLGGSLSHTKRLPKNTTYIGLLSQFEQQAATHTGSYLLVLLSGPESQRSILSAILWEQVQRYEGKVVFVEGTEQALRPKTNPNHITYHKTLAGGQLSELIMGANMVICRSGYSTLMDLVLLGKKAILIPTPGQTEQVYLAKHLQEQGVFPYFEQIGFDLEKAPVMAGSFAYHFPKLQEAYSGYKKVLDEWLSEI